MKRYIAFIRIVELGSFTKAAEELGYTQSGISQMVRSLENELSTVLLLRSRSGIRLTLEGSKLLPLIRSVCNSQRELTDKANELHGLKSGVIRIGTYSSISCHWLPKLMKGFKEQYPDIHFELHQGNYTEIENWIIEGKVDFGFLNPAGAMKLETIILKKDRMLAILPLNHPLAHLDVIPVEQLAKEPFILLEERETNKSLQTFRQNGLNPDIRFKVYDDYTIMSMVESSLGIAILPELVLSRTAYKIAAKEVAPPILRTIGIAFKKKSALSAASRYFIDYLVSEYNDGTFT